LDPGNMHLPKKTYFKFLIYFEKKLAHNSPHSICALKVLRKKKDIFCAMSKKTKNMSHEKPFSSTEFCLSTQAKKNRFSIRQLCAHI
jgi:hypothetical protein